MWPKIGVVLNKDLTCILMASGMDEKASKRQLYLLLHVMGNEGVEVYNTFKFDNEEDRYNIDSYQQILQILQSVQERHVFYTRN